MEQYVGYKELVLTDEQMGQLYNEGKISQETALTYSDNKSELEQMMRGIYHGTSANK